MEEGVKMARFNHPNVMRLIGVCIDKGASPYIVMPYMAYGSLLSYLKKHRVELTLVNDEDQALVWYLYTSQYFITLSFRHPHNWGSVQKACKDDFYLYLVGNRYTNKAPFHLSPSCKGNVVFSNSAICPQRPGSQELHVSYMPSICSPW